MVRNIGANYDRFKMQQKGGHYANSTADNHGFKKEKPLVEKPIEKHIVMKGRPLW